MISDIVVRAAGDDLAARVTIHPEGTIRHDGEARFGPQLYRAGAFLPRGSARAATRGELAVLHGGAVAPGRNHAIGIVRLPAALVDALRFAWIGEGRIDPDALRAAPFDQLPGALAPGWRVDGDLLPLGYARNPAGFHTVTFDARAARFIGLHIDDLDALPLARREESTNRICVNLGQDARHLLFVNVGAPRMAQMLTGRAAGDDAWALRATPLIHAFLGAFPGYPVFRLAVFPGEAYIAPTENMIHDGSTLGMTADDRQLTVRGRVEPA